MKINNKSNNLIAPVELVDYNPAWPRMFEDYKKEIDQAIGGYISTIEHIGSTSVPGLFAKPEIDIMVGVRNLNDAKKCIAPLKEIGYVYFPKFEEFVPERRYFRKSDGLIPLVHIHMVETSSKFWKEHILFRNHLRNNSEAREEYNNLKKKLIVSSGKDRGIYQDGKERFIKRIIKLAGHL